MAVSEIVRDKRELKKFLKACTGLPVYEAKGVAMSAFNNYITLTDEAIKNDAHITFYQGSWHYKEGGEYKICVYVPMIGNRTNVPYLKLIVRNIANALDDMLGEDNWNECNSSLMERWRPLSRFSFYIQIPNFK